MNDLTPKYTAEALFKGISGVLVPARSIDRGYPAPSLGSGVPLALTPVPCRCKAIAGLGQALLIRGFLSSRTSKMFTAAASCCALRPCRCQLGADAVTFARWRGLIPTPASSRDSQHRCSSISSCQGFPTWDLLCASSQSAHPQLKYFSFQAIPCIKLTQPKLSHLPPLHTLINAPSAVNITSPNVLHLSKIAAFYGGSLFHQESEQKYFQSTPSDLFRFPTHHISL